jgi:small conductance mechanosensitive channel
MRQFWHDLKILESINWNALSIAVLRVALIVLLAVIAARLLQRLIPVLRDRIAGNLHDTEQLKRAETLARACRYAVTVVVSAMAVMLILAELGVSIAPMLGAAGVVGLAVGFGAQSLIKDYFTGFFILLENQVRQDDVIEAAGKSGLVEEVTLRYVRLRDYDGVVHFVPNHLITTVSNMSRGFAQAVIDVGVAYREDVDEVLGLMHRVGEQLRRDEGFGPKILEELEIAGVEKWAESAVVLRCRFKVRPLEQWNVRREYLRRLKKAFDAHGIEIPYPHLTVYAGQPKEGAATPSQLASAPRH